MHTPSLAIIVWMHKSTRELQVLYVLSSLEIGASCQVKIIAATFGSAQQWQPPLRWLSSRRRL